jgi:hypothetical protein
VSEPSARPRIVLAANWLADHERILRDCHYTEDSPERMSSVLHPFTVPFVSDCSSGVTALFNWGDARDPSKLNFRGDPYTGTLIEKGRLISASSARSCDVVIFGPYTGWHAAMVLEGGPDPLAWSMGEEGDPRIYRVSTIEQGVAYVNNVKSCEVRYFRFDTSRR